MRGIYQNGNALKSLSRDITDWQSLTVVDSTLNLPDLARHQKKEGLSRFSTSGRALTTSINDNAEHTAHYSGNIIVS